ncbi:MAG: helix-turn-helix domain-containing protein [Micromonosporaceae bacterium]
MTDAEVSLPALVRALRQRALLSQEELADRSGLSIGTIRGLESGRIRKPRGASVRQLAKVLAHTDADRERLLAAARGDAGAVRATPAQLPLPATGFAGRGGELRRLDDMAAGSDGAHPMVVTVAGTAGVGKTALAVHWPIWWPIGSRTASCT